MNIAECVKVAAINYNDTDAFVVELRHITRNLQKEFELYDVHIYNYIGTTKKFEQLDIKQSNPACMYFAPMYTTRKIYSQFILEGCTGFFNGLEIVVKSENFDYAENLIKNMNLNDNNFVCYADKTCDVNNKDYLSFTVIQRFVINMLDLLNMINLRTSQAVNLTLQDFKRVKRIDYFKLSEKTGNNKDDINTITFTQDININEDGEYVDDQGNVISLEQSSSYQAASTNLILINVFIIGCHLLLSS